MRVSVFLLNISGRPSVPVSGRVQSQYLFNNIQWRTEERIICLRESKFRCSFRPFFRFFLRRVPSVLLGGLLGVLDALLRVRRPDLYCFFTYCLLYNISVNASTKVKVMNITSSARRYTRCQLGKSGATTPTLVWKVMHTLIIYTNDDSSLRID